MMQVTAVSFANFGGTNKNTFKSNIVTDAAPKCNTNTYSLPGYNVSFGALIKEYKRNPGVMLDREERKELDDKIQDIIKFEGTSGTEIEDGMKKLFEEYSNNKTALKYIIFRGINKLSPGKSGKNDFYEPYPDFVKTYLKTVNSYFENNKTKCRELLKAAILMPNKDGKTLAHATLKTFDIGSNGVMKAIFDETKDFPSLQLMILNDKDSWGKTIGERLSSGFKTSNDCIAVNDALYNLAARTKSLSKQDSIDLLRTHEKILNDHNKDVLEALQSEECICTIAPQKEQEEIIEISKYKPKDKPQEQRPVFGTPRLKMEQFAYGPEW